MEVYDSSGYLEKEFQTWLGNTDISVLWDIHRALACPPDICRDMSVGAMRDQLRHQLHQTKASEVTHEDLVNRVLVLNPDMDSCSELTRRGFMRFVGNQHNPEWQWVRESLVRLSDELLIWLCETVKTRRREAGYPEEIPQEQAVNRNKGE